MSLESMLANLDQETDIEKKKIFEEAERQIREIHQEADERSKKIREDLVSKAKELMDIEEAFTLGNARAQANRILLEARQKEIEKVFEHARENIRLLPKEADYPELFFSLVRESLTGISGKVIAEISIQDGKLANECFKRLKREVEVETHAKIQSGIVIKTPDQRLVIENTLESRLSKALGMLRAEVAQKLWAKT